MAVPLMLGSGPAHGLAPDLHLRPVLSELPATCPLPGLCLIDEMYRTDSGLEAYVERWAPVVGILTAR